MDILERATYVRYRIPTWLCFPPVMVSTYLSSPKVSLKEINYGLGVFR